MAVLLERAESVSGKFHSMQALDPPERIRDTGSRPGIRAKARLAYFSDSSEEIVGGLRLGQLAK
jgi:hypothetical protein